MNYPHLFSPVTVNSMELANRIVMTAMHLGYTPEGEVTDRLIEFYRRRAEGGVGLIIVGGCPVDEYGGMAGMIGIDDDRYIPGLARLTSAVKTGGARIAAQLYQGGRYVHSSMIGGRKPFSASAVRSKLTGETPRALSREEIPGVQASFAQAAVRAVAGGFDGVELLGSAGYLISQFLSPVTNRREDDYGGSLTNRMRFGIEVVHAVRNAVGPAFPILMRIAGNEFMEGGHTNREARIFAAELEKAGVDLFNVTGGWHETRVPQLTMFVPRRAFVYLAAGIRQAVSVPVLASNRINDPSVAEAVIRRGEADLVTMARGLLADPDLPNKARLGRAGTIVHCIACNQGCFDNIFAMKPAACLVNPVAGRETDHPDLPAGAPGKVLVIGGGPAGMKAACTAAEQGREVTLVERGERLGGQLLLNRSIPGRREMVTAAEDLMRALEALEVRVVLGREATVEYVAAMNPDAVIVATGAEPAVPGIPGVDGPTVVQAWDLLDGAVSVGSRVVIVGGNAVGLETALHAASIGTLSPEELHFLFTNGAESVETLAELCGRGWKTVTVVEMTPRTGKDIGPSTRWTVKAEVRRLGVSLETGTTVTAITEEGVEVESDQGRRTIPADSVVLAVGSRPVNGLARMLAGVVPELHVIGDAKEPRNALAAIREGYEAGRKCLPSGEARVRR